jgi:SAM-dependent methyltransferase/acyl carrier protein
MNTSEFLNYLDGLNIQLSTNGENLKCSAPPGVLTADLTADITARKVELLALLKTKKSANSDAQLQQFYSAITPASSQAVQTQLDIQHLLRFAPFKEIVPGFSAAELYLQPEKISSYQKQIAAAQTEMMDVLFRGVDFSALNTVLDIGCGISTDLINLARQHPHLQLFGYNITAEQIELGNQRIQAAGHQNQITLYHRDSARDEFPSTIDLALSFQVMHHMQNKAGIFANFGKSLSNGGLVVAAEVLSNSPVLPVEESESSAYFATCTEWAQELAKNHLRVVEAVDVSAEIANFLYDPSFESNLNHLEQGYDPNVKRHLKGFYELGNLLRRNLTVYFLLTIQKDAFLKEETLLQLNQAALVSPTPYAQVMQHLDSAGQPHLFGNGFPRTTAPETKQSSSLLTTLLSQDSTQVRSRLESYLKDKLTLITRQDSTSLDMGEPLVAIGLDSLMFLELRNHIQTDLNIAIANSQMAGEMTTAGLVAIIEEKLQKNGSSGIEKGDHAWIEGEL